MQNSGFPRAAARIAILDEMKLIGKFWWLSRFHIGQKRWQMPMAAERKIQRQICNMFARKKSYCQLLITPELKTSQPLRLNTVACLYFYPHCRKSFQNYIYFLVFENAFAVNFLD